MGEQFGSTGEGVTIDLEDGIADVRFDRADKLNALSPAMFAAIGDAIGWLGEQGKSLRCVVLSGNGRSFCAGIDLGALSSGVGPLGPRTHGPANALQHCIWGWREQPVPVVAALHGHVYGAGLQIALGADIRIATADAQVSVMEMRHGLVPDLGLFALARSIVREDTLRELVYTAKTIGGEEAQALGLVTRIADDPVEEALALARDIASKSPPAIRAAKRLFGQMPEGDAASLLQAESDEQEQLLAGVMAKLRG